MLGPSMDMLVSTATTRCMGGRSSLDTSIGVFMPSWTSVQLAPVIMLPITPSRPCRQSLPPQSADG